MKYFFLSEGWVTGRIWASDGLWNEIAWRRKPAIEPLAIVIHEQGERLILHRVEAEVLMVEVKPQGNHPSNIGQVVLKRLITADQVLDRLAEHGVDIAD